MKGPCDRHSDGTATLEKIDTQYEHIRKWMVEFHLSLRVVSLKLLELIKFTSLIALIYFSIELHILHTLVVLAKLVLGN